jgi:phosphatidylglycerol:prolipoprotein diacylglycerol transferase
MNLLLLFINWNPNPTLCHIFGISIRYYGLLWVIGIALSYVIVHRQYKDRKIDEKVFEPLFFYCFFGILIGARLGHCCFYEPERFLTSIKGIVEMILPIEIYPGGWKFTGYMGLASHGGTLGLMIALYMYCRKMKKYIHFMDLLDIIAVATPICACCIRLANLMNSEIVGKITNVPWAFVFERLGQDPSIVNPLAPRHPAQLYEAIAYFVFFLVMMILYHKYKGHLRRGFYFGLCLALIFTFRFFVEFIKEDQVNFEQGMFLNMGQLLSIPFVIAGIYFMFYYQKGRSLVQK